MRAPTGIMVSTLISLSLQACSGINDGRTEYIENGQDAKCAKLGKLVTTSADKRFMVYDSGVILDTKTKLEWLVGPDRAINYNDAEAWVKACSAAGGGWRMPTMEQLKELYEEGKGSLVKEKGKEYPANMDPVFRPTELWVWAEPRDTESAFLVGRHDGCLAWGPRPRVNADGRVYAVRSDCQSRGQ